MIKKYRNLILVFIDMVIIFFAYFATYFFKDVLIRNLSLNDINTTFINIAVAIFLYQLLFCCLGLYNNITRFESGKEYFKYIFVTVSATLYLMGISFIPGIVFHSAKVNLLAGIFITLGLISYRIMIRFILNEDIKFISKKNDKRKRVLIIGAGKAGKDIILNIKSDLNNEYKIVGIIDDSEFKLSYSILGVKILGSRNDIYKICKEQNVEYIFFTICNIKEEQRRKLLEICQSTNLKVKVLPGVKELILNKNMYNNLRNVEIEDLLGREVNKLDNHQIEELIKGKVVLVTGAGGSIGSELCRQIVKFMPNKLVMIDVYENNLYDIEGELRRNHPNINIEPLIASIRDNNRLEEIFEKENPYIVFHAAAHKHVPLMEKSPIEAIKNNVFGTWNVINCCDKYKVKRYIQISTDKAVNPTNIMGATKRMCEMMLQAKNKNSNTEYAGVRFGNVLGSNGSVIPLFKKQIEKGGPVTLTHKEITRYFMTIPEAVSLVLQAMTYANGGEIFVLDMGKPVKIYDLAKTLIKLSGYEPDIDIKIEEVGLRPGEKLYEELLMDSNTMKKTKNEKIFIENPSDITINDVEKKLSKLDKLIKIENVSLEEVKEVIKDVIPTYYEANK